MEEAIKRLLKYLRIEYWTVVAILLLLVVLCETEVIPNGMFATNEQAEFVFNVTSILIVLVNVPLALKLFSLNTTRSLHRYTFDGALRTYHVWSLVRLLILLAAAFFSLLSYYYTLTSTGLLCAAIVVLVMCYCLPSSRKLHDYLEDAKEDKE